MMAGLDRPVSATKAHRPAEARVRGAGAAQGACSQLTQGLRCPFSDESRELDWRERHADKILENAGIEKREGTFKVLGAICHSRAHVVEATCNVVSLRGLLCVCSVGSAAARTPRTRKSKPDPLMNR